MGRTRGYTTETRCYTTAARCAFPTRLQVGAILCATDPVAVVALLRDLGASKKLSTVIEGESLFNDGTAIVVFKLFFELAKGVTYSPTEVVVFFLQVRRPSLLY